MREDLFYRLSSISINVPCLKDRKSDIPLLCKYFIELYNKEMGMNIIGVSDEVLEIFYKYNWQGNIRELKNTIEAAFNFASSNILEKADLPDHIQDYINLKNYRKSDSVLQDIIKDNEQSLDDALSEFEKLWILNKAESIYSLSHLADKLKISKQTLNYKLKKYNLKINAK